MADTVQDVEILSLILRDIRNLLSTRYDLAKVIKYDVRARGQNDRARFARLLHYQGPDDDTINTLTDCHDQWLENPMSFWIRPGPSFAFDWVDAQARIVGYYLQTKLDDV